MSCCGVIFEPLDVAAIGPQMFDVTADPAAIVQHSSADALPSIVGG
jgi:hypothetical protein